MKDDIILFLIDKSLKSLKEIKMEDQHEYGALIISPFYTNFYI